MGAGNDMQQMYGIWLKYKLGISAQEILSLSRLQYMLPIPDLVDTIFQIAIQNLIGGS